MDNYKTHICMHRNWSENRVVLRVTLGQ